MPLCKVPLSSPLLATLLLIFSEVGSTVMVCYYPNWAQYRPAPMSFRPRHIPPHACTHIIYSFANVNTTTGQVTILEANDPELYRELNALKQTNPSLKTLLAFGGAGSKSTELAMVATSTTKRAAFINSTTFFLRKHAFDGADLDWEYPNKPGEKAVFSTLVEEMYGAFESEAGSSSAKPRLLLSSAVGVGKQTIDDSYDVPTIQKYLDFVNIMTYDMRGAWWPNKAGIHCGLYPSTAENPNEISLNTNWVVQQYLTLGLPRDKLIMGVAFYGRSFALCNATENQVGDPICGAGSRGTYTQEAGFLAYYEICADIKQHGWTRQWRNDVKGPYAYKGNQWVGYDDVDSLKEKVSYIKTQGLGGAMLWELSLDDFNGDCGSTFPLLMTLSSGLNVSNNFSTRTPHNGPTTQPSIVRTTKMVSRSSKLYPSVSCTGYISLVFLLIFKYT